MKKLLISILTLCAIGSANATSVTPTLSANLGSMPTKINTDVKRNYLYWDIAAGINVDGFIFETGYMRASKKHDGDTVYFNGLKTNVGYAIEAAKDLDVSFKLGMNLLGLNHCTQDEGKKSIAKQKFVPSIGTTASYNISDSVSCDLGLNYLFLSKMKYTLPLEEGEEPVKLKINNSLSYTLGFTYKI